MASNDDKRPSLERRVFNLTNAEVRMPEEGSSDRPVFSGYAAVFNELSVNLGGFRERIKPGAFRSAIEGGDDVRFLINHNADKILGRTPKTLTLSEDDMGLRVECELPNTSYANDLAESMSRGDISQMSFGFTTRADSWPEKDTETGLPIRQLDDVGLFDVSAVAYPAYPDTTAEVRSLIETEHPEILERAQRAAEELLADEIVLDHAHEENDERDGGDAEEVAADIAEAAEIAAAKENDASEADETTENTPEADEHAGLREEYEQLRAAAGVRVEENGWPGCDNVAVVWNWNDEVQSCHDDRAAADAQVEALTSGGAGAARDKTTTVTMNFNVEGLTELEEAAASMAAAFESLKVAAEEGRAGKVLSKENQDKLTQAHELLNAVLSMAGEPDPGEASTELSGYASIREFVASLDEVDMDTVRAELEERGWSWDDDWNILVLTDMIADASCFLLFNGGDADNDRADDEPQAGVMREVMTRLMSLLDGAAAAPARSSLDRERRRLALREREVTL